MLILITKPIWSLEFFFYLFHFKPERKKSITLMTCPSDLFTGFMFVMSSVLIETKPKQSSSGCEKMKERQKGREKMLFWLLWHNNEVYGELWTRRFFFDLYTFLRWNEFLLTFTGPGYIHGLSLSIRPSKMKLQEGERKRKTVTMQNKWAIKE